MYPREDWEHQARIRVANLRATWSRSRGDADVEALVNGLLTRSEEFRVMWERHEVGVPGGPQELVQPRIGSVSVECGSSPRRRRSAAIVLSAPPASEAYGKLKLLGVLGDQEVGA